MTHDFDRLLMLADTDPDVVGVLLGGSRGKGLGTPDSDWDVYVVVSTEEDVPRVSGQLKASQSHEIDVCGVFTVKQFEEHASVGDSFEWNRYNFAHVVPALDRTPGGVLQRLCDEKEWLPEPVARERAGFTLDAYLNSYYRALKNRRDGNDVAAALDAAEAVPLLLQFVFTAEGRARPYNKFLVWELATHPLERPWWPVADVPSLLLEVLRDANLASLALAFRHLEREARQQGFEEILDAWGPTALRAMREGTVR